MSASPRSRGTLALANLSAQATLRYGVVLGLLLAGALVGMLAHDRNSRIAASEQQAITLANSTQGLVTLELRNLERAAAGIAGDYARLQSTLPDLAPSMLQRSIDDVLHRHLELESIVVVDAGGVARSAGVGDPALPTWSAMPPNGDDADRLRLGPPTRAGDGGYVLPLAMPMRATPGAGWVLMRLRVSELQSLLDSIDAGPNSLITLLTHERVVLARTLAPETYVGRRLEDATLAHLIASGVERQIDRDEHHVDGVDRTRAFVAMERFPLVIGAGIARDATLGTWYAFVACGVIGYVLYWIGFLHLLGIIRRSDRHQARMRAQIAEAAERLSLAQRAGHMISWSIRPGEDRFDWSSDTTEIFGVPPDDANLHYVSFQQLIHPDDRAAFVAQARAARDNGQDLIADYRIVRPDGAVRSMSVRGGHIVLPDGSRRMTGVVMDVTERVATQGRLLEAERRFRLMFDSNPLPFWVFDVETLRFVEVNAAALRSYGYSREEFLAMTLEDIRPPDQIPALLDDLDEPRDSYRAPKLFTHRRRDGSLLQVRVHSADMVFAGREVRLVLAEDVTESQHAQEQLAYRASHDVLTDLPNGHSFLQQLERLLTDAAGAVAVVHVQFRRFALITDSLGHAIGEEVLVQAARRLREFVAGYGIAARLQGHEFVLALQVPATDPDAGGLVERLSRLFGDPVTAAGAPQHLDATFGLALYPQDGRAAEQLMRNAGLAAHAIPAEQPSGTMRYSAALAEQMTARLAMLLRLHRAIEQEEFSLCFQPIFDLRSSRLAAYEALVRWPQPGGGQVPPGEFIGLCEDSGLIVPLGSWVLREAARAWLAFSAAGHAVVPIAVNISITQFLRSDIVEEVRAVLAELSLPAGALELEITEGVVMSDPEHVIHTIERLHAMGVCLAIDDFGTGYSNLAYLHRLPAQTLKIDRIFVHAVDSDPQKAAICRSIMSLTTNFDMRVTAEGIETPAQLAWLKYHGCDQAQGYLLGRPAPIEHWLATPPAFPREDVSLA